mgnify:CR=1 FL=1
MPERPGGPPPARRLSGKQLLLFAIAFLGSSRTFLDRVGFTAMTYAVDEIRMLPVVQPDGKSTARRILVYSLLLIPVSLTQPLLGMSGRAYLIGACFSMQRSSTWGWRLIALRALSARSRNSARPAVTSGHSVLYLPLLFVLMMLSRIYVVELARGFQDPCIRGSRR